MDPSHSDQHSPSPNPDSQLPQSSLYRVSATHAAEPLTPSLKSLSSWPSPRACIPGLLPPGMDPASVDFRTFYPYIPNEVKHRKRTTRSQLNVLEDLFRHDTKPNAALRKKLAAELNMTPRGVQVWFQNRRAKEKAISKKAIVASKTATTPSLRSNDSSKEEASPKEDSPRSSVTEIAPISPEDCLSRHVERSPSQQSSPVGNTASESTPDSLQTPCPTPPSGSPRNVVSATRAGLLQVDDTHLLNLRRPSLPTLAYPQPSHAYGPPSVGLDPMSRRRSVDTSLHRLAAHPYAHLAMAKNGVYYGGVSRSSPLHQRPAQLSSSATQPTARAPPSFGLSHGRPGLSHRASMPQGLFTQDSRQRLSWDSQSPLSHPSRTVSSPSHSPPRISRFTQASRGSLPDHHLYAFTSRMVASPIPGPLPTPNFSFGAPSSSSSAGSPENERDSPDHISGLQGYTFARTEEPDTEDDATSASYDAFSRFGSIASMMGSESSTTSAYFSSETGSCAADHELNASCDPSARRGSYASGPFVELMSGLDVSSPVGESNVNANLGVRESFPSQENLTAMSVPVNDGMHPAGAGDISSSVFSSPTASLGDSSLMMHLRIQGKDELTYALQGNQEQATNSSNGYVVPTTEAPAPVEGSAERGMTFGYVSTSTEAGSVYGHSISNSSSSSSLSLPVLSELPEKFHFNNGVGQISSTGNYQDLHAYVASGEGHYSVKESYSAAADVHEALELHHALEYSQCPSGSEIYSSYATTSDISAAPPTFENDLHAIDTFGAYS